AFLAHQAVEKALKAYIIAFKRVRPPRTHDLVELAAAASIRLEPSEVEGLSELSPYYVVSRYPSAGLRKPWKEIARGTSLRFLSTAEKIVGKIEELFKQAQQG
ncbi:MAG: HEPN domain-containing protein, partial [Thermofilum sp.]